MKILRTVGAAAAVCAAALFCGCEGAISIGSAKLPDFSGGYSANAEITFGNEKAQAEIDRVEPGCWEFRFSEPKELSGVVMKLENGEVTASLGEISVAAGEGDYTMLPVVIAEGLDELQNLTSDSFTEENGVLTAKLEAFGSKCTVTADKQTGDVLSFKSPSDKLAVYFSEVSPYTEEVGLIEE
ncbi:MAG: hypothetical protein ACI4WS_10870 [Oscillospiraceae bacterium]